WRTQKLCRPERWSNVVTFGHALAAMGAEKRKMAALDLGEVISKRLRSAHKSLLAAVVDREGFSAQTGDVAVTAWPGQMHRLLLLRAETSPAAEAPAENSLEEGPEPGPLARALLCL
ncbi:unnamed protein product, partial [Effrenium voratum]